MFISVLHWILRQSSGFMSSDFSSETGLSNSDAIFSTENDISGVECRFMLRKSTTSFRHECPNSYSAIKEREDKEDKIKTSSSEGFPSSLEVKLPAPEQESAVEEDDDGFKTPTSMDHKIPTTLPPAPMKPKPRQPSKRKAHSRDRIFIDLSTEIESMFPLVFHQRKNKKFKKANENE